MLIARHVWTRGEGIRLGAVAKQMRASHRFRIYRSQESRAVQYPTRACCQAAGTECMRCVRRPRACMYSGCPGIRRSTESVCWQSALGPHGHTYGTSPLANPCALCSTKRSWAHPDTSRAAHTHRGGRRRDTQDNWLSDADASFLRRRTSTLTLDTTAHFLLHSSPDVVLSLFLLFCVPLVYFSSVFFFCILLDPSNHPHAARRCRCRWSLRRGLTWLSA